MPPPFDESDDEDRIKLQLVFKSQFCSVQGTSRIEVELKASSELLQLLMAAL